MRSAYQAHRQMRNTENKGSAMVKWTSDQIPLLTGRTAVVTGVGGLGFECALALSHAGAEVILAGRNPAKGTEAIASIKQRNAGAKIKFETLDLASLNSVAEFGARLRNHYERLDMLINNAGVMAPAAREITRDGFELQLGTNHLGHFALTAHLLPLLRRGDRPRVISLSSLLARQGRISFSDLQYERGYKPFAAYAQSKLACLMFALELERRSSVAGWGVESIAAHPGIARTNLIENGPGRHSAFGIFSIVAKFLFQSPAQGALPTLFAATSPSAKNGAYYGPDGLGETRGYPALAKIPLQARDDGVAQDLWEISERLTGVSFSTAALGI
ncbi:MAG TPA: SDR family oxidoreductase [Rhodocyclaceae bacterium]|nr:SDR family oxidoreductase [Rhodocyclaceae bacterium]